MVSKAILSHWLWRLQHWRQGKAGNRHCSCKAGKERVAWSWGLLSVVWCFLFCLLWFGWFEFACWISSMVFDVCLFSAPMSWETRLWIQQTTVQCCFSQRCCRISLWAWHVPGTAYRFGIWMIPKIGEPSQELQAYDTGNLNVGWVLVTTRQEVFYFFWWWSKNLRYGKRLRSSLSQWLFFPGKGQLS